MINVYSSPLDFGIRQSPRDYFQIDFNAAAIPYVCLKLGCSVTTLPEAIRSEVSSYVSENGPTIEYNHVIVIAESDNNIEKWGMGLKISFHETAWCYIENANLQGFNMTGCLEEMINDLTEGLPSNACAYATVEHVW